jgi:NitT/TauT family transport system substrate-binding protein
MQHRGVHIQALVLLARTYGLVIALSKELAAKYRSPRDLKGLRIGVSAPGSTTALVLEVFLRKAGMTLDDVSVIAVGQSAAAVAAMKYGKIDGIVNPDPVSTKLVNDGDAVAILDSRTEQGAKDMHGGYLASSAVLTTPEFVARRPAAAQAFTNAMVRTLVWLRTASIEDIMAHLPPEYFAGDAALYRQALIANRRNYSEDGRITTELASNTLALLKIGPLADAGPLDLGRTHVDTFVERALKLY